MNPLLMSQLEQAIPEGFPFYHLGEILLAEREEATPPPSESALGYRLQGDVRGLLVILLEEGLDLSIYAEAGNVIASRLAGSLSKQAGLDVMISPPQPVSPSRLRQARPSLALERTYLHRHGDHLVEVRMHIYLDDEMAGSNV